MVYGKEVVLTPNVVLPYLSLVHSIEEQPCSFLQQILTQILKLDKERKKENQSYPKHYKALKYWFNSNSFGSKYFQFGDLVLKWDKADEEKRKHTEFQKLWLSPFQIAEQLGPSDFILQDLKGRK